MAIREMDLINNTVKLLSKSKFQNKIKTLHLDILQSYDDYVAVSILYKSFINYRRVHQFLTYYSLFLCKHHLIQFYSSLLTYLFQSYLEKPMHRRHQHTRPISGSYDKANLTLICLI